MFLFGEKTLCNFFYYISQISLVFAMEKSELSYCGIKFEVKKNGYSDINYILIHGDEETAKMLLNEHIQNNQGRAFFIKSKEREVPIGSTIVDPNRIFSRSGAEKALKNGKSLLAIGIIKIDGSFSKGDNILILNENNDELARGLSSFSSKELIKIIGKRSKEIEKILGYPSKSEVVHIDDMVRI